MRTLALTSAIAAAICSLAISGFASTAAANDQEKAKENFLQADANADGALTIDEFTRMIDLNAEEKIGRASLVQRTGRYKTAFERIDANSNGLVETEELAAMANR